MIYYKEYFSLLIPVFFLTLLCRLIFLRIIRTQLKKGKVGFNVLLLGSQNRAFELYQQFIKSDAGRGYHITGFVNTNGQSINSFPSDIKIHNSADNLSNSADNLSSILKDEKIEEVIITVNKNERERITAIFRNLSDKNVNIKMTPDTVDIISGSLQTNNVLGVPLIDVHSGIMPGWQQNLKRMIDLIVAIVGLIILSPLMLFTIIRLLISSPGSIIYRQERIGYKGKAFTMYKFRSMVADAEKDGPQLSSETDVRITKWGKVMRKWRLDELPQLWNILKGEMSLVGPAK